MPVIGSPAHEKFESGLEHFRRGDLQKGLEDLREARRLAPEEIEILGHLAWGCIGAGEGQEAVALYEELMRLDPENAEIPVRHLQAMIVRDGYKRSYLEEMQRLARRSGLDGELWVAMGQLAASHGDEEMSRSILAEGARLFPDHTRFQLRKMEARQQSRRRLVRFAASLLQLEKVFDLLLRSAAFRRLLRKHSGSSADYLYSALMDFYRVGSVSAKFPQSPSEQLPENFSRHAENCRCSWFKWMMEQTPQKSPKGLKLVDVGCGPGFVGHHFADVGFEVTAVSGSPEELAECARRGMKTAECEMHQMPLPSGSYDAVLASHVLEHSVAPMLLIWEIKRLLKPGGILYVNLPLPIDAEPRRDFPESYDPKTESYILESDELCRSKIPELSYYSYGFPPHVFVLTYWQWRWVFRQAGLEHLASVIEFPGGRQVEPNKALEELGNRPHHCNQFFLLRRP